MRQTDGVSWRNLVLTRAQLLVLGSVVEEGLPPETDAAVVLGQGDIEIDSVHDLLRRVGLPEDAPLTALAVEVFNLSVAPVRDPVGASLGFARILRVSPLAPVPEAC